MVLVVSTIKYVATSLTRNPIITRAQAYASASMMAAGDVLRLGGVFASLRGRFRAARNGQGANQNHSYPEAAGDDEQRGENDDRQENHVHAFTRP